MCKHTPFISELRFFYAALTCSDFAITYLWTIKINWNKISYRNFKLYRNMLTYKMTKYKIITSNKYSYM